MLGFDERLGDGQAEAEAAEEAFGVVVALFEGIEEAGEGVGRHADAGVGDLEGDGALGEVDGVDGDRAAGGGEFDGIFEDVPHDLLEASGVAADEVVAGVEGEGELLAFFRDVGADDADDGGEEVVEVEGFEVEGEFVPGDAGEVEDGVGEACFEVDVSAEHADVFADGFGEVVAGLPEVEGGDDGGEGCAEFVAEGGDEAVFGAVGGFGFGLGLEEAALGVLVFGEIAEDEDDAVDLAGLVTDGGAAVVDRDFGAVFSDEEGVVGESDDEAGAEDFFDGAFDGVAGVFVDDVEDFDDGLAAGFGEGPAGEGFGDGVHEGDAGVEIGDEDGVADAAEGDGEEVFLAAGFGEGGGAAFDFGDDAGIGPEAEEEFEAGGGEEDEGAPRGGVVDGVAEGLEGGFLIGDGLVEDVAEVVHYFFAGVGIDDGLSGFEAVFAAEVDSAVELGEFVVGEGGDFCDGGRREETGGGLLLELGEVGVDGVDGVVVGLEVFVVAGEEEAALAGLGVFEGGEGLLELLDDGEVLDDLLVGGDDEAAGEVGDDAGADEDDDHEREKPA